MIGFRLEPPGAYLERDKTHWGSPFEWVLALKESLASLWF